MCIRDRYQRRVHGEIQFMNPNKKAKQTFCKPPLPSISRQIQQLSTKSTMHTEAPSNIGGKSSARRLDSERDDSVRINSTMTQRHNRTIMLEKPNKNYLKKYNVFANPSSKPASFNPVPLDSDSLKDFSFVKTEIVVSKSRDLLSKHNPFSTKGSPSRHSPHKSDLPITSDFTLTELQPEKQKQFVEDFQSDIQSLQFGKSDILDEAMIDRERQLEEDKKKLEIKLIEAQQELKMIVEQHTSCLLYTSPSPRDLSTSRMPSSA
eukprot:TRINITY_DN30503_c0_g1_i4.p1 TRINITY_DN30503_c0_g1~~TRINITY_DN30503_c0_g1_i4.p1  ORF type:complete len:263 (-),score=39.05 TRINITY_DN30503_c0_g1_i4:136-924(-)